MLESEIISLRKEKEQIKAQNRKNQSFTQPSSYFNKEQPGKASQPNLELGGTSQQFQNYLSDDSRLKPYFSPQMVGQSQFSVLKNKILKAPSDSLSAKAKIFKDIQMITKQKQVDNMKFNYEINRLKIKVDDRSLDNERLKQQNNELFNQMKKLKDKVEESEKNEWLQEANSDKNPNLINYYKKKAETKEKEIKQLKKSQKKFVILEKKLLVKEKAFEGERAFYHE